MKKILFLICITLSFQTGDVITELQKGLIFAERVFDTYFTSTNYIMLTKNKIIIMQPNSLSGEEYELKQVEDPLNASPRSTIMKYGDDNYLVSCMEVYLIASFSSSGTTLSFKHGVSYTKPDNDYQCTIAILKDYIAVGQILSGTSVEVKIYSIDADLNFVASTIVPNINYPNMIDVSMIKCMPLNYEQNHIICAYLDAPKGGQFNHSLNGPLPAGGLKVSDLIDFEIYEEKIIRVKDNNYLIAVLDHQSTYEDTGLYTNQFITTAIIQDGTINIGNFEVISEFYPNSIKS